MSIPPEYLDPPGPDVFGDLRVPRPMVAAQELDAIAVRAAAAARRSKAENTLRTYRSAWRQYTAWCARFNFEPICADPRIVALHIADISERLAPATIGIRLSAIVDAHRQVGLQLDLKHLAITTVTGGAVRVRGHAPKRQAKPILSPILHRLAESCPDTAVGIRDRAMLLLGFGAACRRSELVALRIADITIEDRGVVVSLHRSKTDQTGEGTIVAIHGSEEQSIDVRAALVAWLAIRGKSSHALRGVSLSDEELGGQAHLFCALSKSGRPLGRKLSDYAVVRMIKGAALRAGIDPEGYSGHSLRSVLTTTASTNGASLAEIMDQGR